VRRDVQVTVLECYWRLWGEARRASYSVRMLQSCEERQLLCRDTCIVTETSCYESKKRRGPCHDSGG
jgi:hypothetical protein